MRFLDKFRAMVDKIFRRTQAIESFRFDWGIPKDAQAALRALFPDLRGDFQKPDGTQHPQPVRYIRHKRRAGSPYRRKREEAVCSN